MEGADANFMKKMKPGDIIVGGKNFGCGSSREHAPIAIKAAGISCVIAESFSRIFYRNAINIGLLIFTSPAAKDLLKGDVAEVDTDKGEIRKAGSKKQYSAEIFPRFIQDIMKSGGLMAYAAKRRK
jgi:3-isopropylmalate dehydratase small subunit